MDNLSLQEEPFGRLNLDELGSIHEYYYYNFDAGDVLARILELGITGASILSCITLVYVIIKFDHLQTRTNMYILHYSICLGTFYCLLPLYELLLNFGFYFYSHGPIICAFYRIDGTMISLSLIFTAALSCDWLLVSLDVPWLEKYEQFQKYIICIIYLVHLSLYVETVISCFGLDRLFTEDATIYVYLIMAVIVVLINCFRFKKPTEASNKHKYALIISTYMTLSWLPMLCLHYLAGYFRYELELEISSEILLFVSENVFKFMILSLPLVSAVWLDSLNDDFRKAYRIVFGPKGNHNPHNMDDDDESRLIENERGQS